MKRLLAVALVACTLLGLVDVATSMERSFREGQLVFRNLSPFVWLFDQPAYASYVPLAIKSINRNAGTQTITAVVTANTIVRYLGCLGVSGDTDARNILGTVVLTDTTHVTVGGAGAASCGWEAVEYTPGVLKSMQRGTITIASGGAVSNTAAITAVTTAKAECVWGGLSETGSASFDGGFSGKVVLTSSILVTATVGTTAGMTWTVPYQVAEWFR